MAARRFPELRDLVVEWEDLLPSGGGAPVVTGAFPCSLRPAGGMVEAVLACQNPRCQEGGFEVGFLIESMIDEGVEERTGVLVCIGWEGKQGDRRGSPCTCAISYRVRLSYTRAVRRATVQGENGKSHEV